jgi:hypothetical protein
MYTQNLIVATGILYVEHAGSSHQCSLPSPSDPGKYLAEMSTFFMFLNLEDLACDAVDGTTLRVQNADLAAIEQPFVALKTALRAFEASKSTPFPLLESYAALLRSRELGWPDKPLLKRLLTSSLQSATCCCAADPFAKVHRETIKQAVFITCHALRLQAQQVRLSSLSLYTDQYDHWNGGTVGQPSR